LEVMDGRAAIHMVGWPSLQSPPTFRPKILL
jgi:hypothetical protein